MTKICTKCGDSKPLSEFHRRQAASDGYRARCKACRTKMRTPKIANAATNADYVQQWRCMHPERNKATQRRAELKRKYGITPAAYDALYAAQAGLCAVCGQPETCRHRGKPKRLAVDHDHETGQVRGLLCACCNRAIGFAGEMSARLRALADYLDESMRN